MRLWTACFFVVSTSCVSTVSGDDGDSASDDPSVDLDPELLAAGSSPCRDPVKVEVTSVVDGDTAWVRSEEGSEKVRFIGVDSTELGYEGSEAECWAEEAAIYVRDWLEGTTIWLTFDEDCEDDYERSLAYLHTGVDEQGFIQRHLLRDGWVTTFTVSPNDEFAAIFAEDEAVAQQAGEGLWGACRR